MEVKSPIFIIGLGRSGSTVFFDIFSGHPDLVWLSQRICNRYPDNPNLNRRLMELINIPITGRLIRRFFEPGECYPYWDYLYRGFSASYRDLLSQDVTNRARSRIRDSLNTMVKKSKDRLIIKITGWNRIRFLKEIFPDALFIHVERDPRAVINSFLNVHFWGGWRGPHHLIMGELTDEQKGELDHFENSFVALAGMQLVMHMDAYHEAKASISMDNLLEVSYEQLCDNSLQIYRDACDFANLKWIDAFERRVRKSRLINSNNKWLQDLNEGQKEIAQFYYEKLLNRYSS